MNYNFKKETSTAKLPTKHTEVSAGIDFYADEATMIPPGGSRKISTGISWKPNLVFIGPELKLSLALIIQSRSGLAFKYRIEASNAGVIDSDYFSIPGKPAIIHVLLYNKSEEWFPVNKGDKICQGIPQLIPLLEGVEILDTSRNAGGFGSSDKKEGIR